MNEQYSSKIDGLPGNDDLGTMGAWYVFACIGLYPEIPGVGGFTVNTPIFSSVKIHLKKGDMVIKGGSEKNIYIKSMKLNGKPYDSTWIDWDQLNNGCLLYTSTVPTFGIISMHRVVLTAIVLISTVYLIGNHCTITMLHLSKRIYYLWR